MDVLLGFNPEFFVPVDLHDAAVVDDNFDGAETQALQDRDYTLGKLLLIFQLW